MQTILGAGGAINELAKALINYTDAIRLVSRTPEKVNETDEVMAADLTDAQQTAAAVEGPQVVYLTAGLPYKTEVWQDQWPEIMHNVIDACRQHNARLVFFDNIYMYDKKYLSSITETTPVKPSSKKGAVRAQIAQMVLDEVRKGRITALIARAADFYGPGVKTSVLQETVYKNLKKGRKADWMGNVNAVHSFTYVPDAAAATALLGNTEDAYNQVWHLPTDSQRWTGKDWIKAVAKALNKPPKYRTLSAGMIKFLGFFIPVLKEIHEMLYQYEQDYYFNSTKFHQRFPDFKTTRYPQGVKAMVQADQG